MCVYVWQALTSESDTPCTVSVQWAATSNGIIINAQCRCVNRSSPMVRVVCFCLCMMMWTRAFDDRGHVSARELNMKHCLKHLGINYTIGCQLVVSFSMHCHRLMKWLCLLCLSLPTQNWAPQGCEALNECLTVPFSNRQRCYWPH